MKTAASLSRLLSAGLLVTLSAGISSAEETKAAPQQAFDVSATAVPMADRVSWHGYYQFAYLDQQKANATFDTHKLAVWMGVKLNEMAYLSSEVEYEHAPETGSDSPGGSGEIKMDSAILRITPVEGSTGYLGLFYVPFGVEYLSYPGHKNKLVTRPPVMVVSGNIIRGTWSDVGVGINQRLGSLGQVDIYVINGDAKNGGVSRDSSAGGNDSKSVGGRVMFDGIAEGLNFGASYVAGKWDEQSRFASSRTGLHARVDTDVMFGSNAAPVIIAEYAAGADEGASSLEGHDKKVSGYYVQASSRVHPLFEIAARYSEYDNDMDAPDNIVKSASAGFTIHAMESVKFKGEYQWGVSDGSKSAGDLLALQVVAFW